MAEGTHSPTAIVLPFLPLTRAHALTYGTIGPMSQVLGQLPDGALLKHFLPNLKVQSDTGAIPDPTFALTLGDRRTFKTELEALIYLVAANDIYPPTDELFTKQATLTTESSAQEQLIRIDEGMWIAPDSVITMKMSAFGYYLWGTEDVDRVKQAVEDIINGQLYKAVTACLVPSADKETRRARQRILVAIALDNGTYVYHGNATQNLGITIISVALGTLLNLPSELIRASFVQAVSTLTGKHSSALKRRCNECYSLRSGLVHGNVVWNIDNY